jgi:acyl carrier protein
MSDLNQQIKKVMAAVFEMDVAEIGDDAAPKIIEKWDSLRHMNLIVALEDEFEFSFTDEEMANLLDFNSILLILTFKTGN